MSGYRNSGLTQEDWEARDTLRAALVLIQDRWPDGLQRWPDGAHFHTLHHLAFLCEQIEKGGEEPTPDGDPDTRCGDPYRTEHHGVARCSRGLGHVGVHAGHADDGTTCQWSAE